MNLNKFITDHYDRLKKIAYNIARKAPIHEDLFHDALIVILGKNFKSEQDAEYYLIQVMYLSINSPTSPFYKSEIAYIKNRTDINVLTLSQAIPDLSDRIVNENLDILVTRLSAFERMVFEQYIVKDFSYDLLSEETGIPKEVLYQTVTKAKTKIRKYVFRQK